MVSPPPAAPLKASSSPDRPSAKRSPSPPLAPNPATHQGLSPAPPAPASSVTPFPDQARPSLEPSRSATCSPSTPAAWGPAPVTLAYLWKANGASISGATAATYTLSAGLVGKKITVTVTGTKTGYPTLAKTSAATATVIAGTLSPTPTPTISGSAKVGYTLTAHPGTWGPPPVTTHYQWRANGAAISGATATTYPVAPAYLGKKIHPVTVTGTKTGYPTRAKTSAATATVIAGTLSPTPTPTISGTAKVGYTLTAHPGTWGPPPVTTHYQWRANGAAISGATAFTYRIAASFVWKSITVTVTGSKTGYTTIGRTSGATVSVASAAHCTPTTS